MKRSFFTMLFALSFVFYSGLALPMNGMNFGVEGWQPADEFQLPETSEDTVIPRNSPSESKCNEKYVKQKKLSLENKLIDGVKDGKKGAVRELLEKGADVNYQDECLWTSLHHAVCKCDIPVVVMLLRMGAGLEIKNEDDKSPEDFVKSLLISNKEKVKDFRVIKTIDTIFKWRRKTPYLLHYAVAQGKEEFVRLFGKWGYSWKEKNTHDCTPADYCKMRYDMLCKPHGAATGQYNKSFCASAEGF